METLPSIVTKTNKRKSTQYLLYIYLEVVCANIGKEQSADMSQRYSIWYKITEHHSLQK